jgi:hypothetical protein
MLALATKVARLFTAPPQTALWTIAVQHRVVGSLVYEAGDWRLAWFKGADPRLVAYMGPVDGDLSGLSRRLSARLGAAPGELVVELESQPV